MGATLRTSLILCSACALAPLAARAATHPRTRPRASRTISCCPPPHTPPRASRARAAETRAAANPRLKGPSAHDRHQGSAGTHGPHAAHRGPSGRHALRAASLSRGRDPRDTYARVHAWEEARQNSVAPEPDDAPAAGTQVLPATGLTASVTELPRVPSIQQEAATPVILPSLHDARGRLVVPAPLYGSHEVLLHQNEMAERDGSTRVRDEEDLAGLRRERKLVPLPEGATLRVDDRLPADRRFSRPWTAAFLSTLAGDFYATFHEPLQVNSAVRTVDVQLRLLRTNGNAAPAAGDTASPHLTGQAVDIGKRNLTLPQIAWMRAYLSPLIEAGKIDVEEEFQQACFHISVYRAYQQPTHVTVAATAAQPTPQPVTPN